MKTCTVDGCESKHLARGLCGTHYNQQHQPNRHPKYEITCETCGEKYLSARKAGRFCSLLCRDVARWRTHWVPALIPRAERIVTQPTVRTDLPRVFTCGVCPWCGEAFTTRQPSAVFCGRACSRRWWRVEWKTRTNRAVSPAVRQQVYARDAGTCQLCFAPVDMTLGPEGTHGPTLDHIVCQSWTLIPDHRATNLRLAHRSCNSARGNRAA